VTVKADCCERGEGRRKNDEFLTVSVSDTGPGIPAEELKYIFDKFYRSPKTAKQKGTGLGLAVVKAVTEGLGGRVTVESEPGKGSTFKMFLPVAESIGEPE
jgi:signal transduction histidine kinase